MCAGALSGPLGSWADTHPGVSESMHEGFVQKATSPRDHRDVSITQGLLSPGDALYLLVQPLIAGHSHFSPLLLMIARLSSEHN